MQYVKIWGYDICFEWLETFAGEPSKRVPMQCILRPWQGFEFPLYVSSTVEFHSFYLWVVYWSWKHFQVGVFMVKPRHTQIHPNYKLAGLGSGPTEAFQVLARPFSQWSRAKLGRSFSLLFHIFFFIPFHFVYLFLFGHIHTKRRYNIFGPGTGLSTT